MTERLHFHFSLSCIGEGNGTPLQCSCLENPRNSGARWAAVYGVAQSRTRLKQLSSSSISKGSCLPHTSKLPAAATDPSHLLIYTPRNRDLSRIGLWTEPSSATCALRGWADGKDRPPSWTASLGWRCPLDRAGDGRSLQANIRPPRCPNLAAPPVSSQLCPCR